MRTLTFGLLGAAVLTAGILLVRQQRPAAATERPRAVPAGETQPAAISLDRIRALGY